MLELATIKLYIMSEVLLNLMGEFFAIRGCWAIECNNQNVTMSDDALSTLAIPKLTPSNLLFTSDANAMGPKPAAPAFHPSYG